MSNSMPIEEMFDEFLNEVYEPITFGYLTFYPADIIKELDPIAYRCGLADYESDLIDRGEYAEL